MESAATLKVPQNIEMIHFSCCFAWPEYDNESGRLTESATRSIEIPTDTPDPLKTGDSSAFLAHFVVSDGDFNRRRGSRIDVAVAR